MKSSVEQGGRAHLPAILRQPVTRVLVVKMWTGTCFASSSFISVMFLAFPPGNKPVGHQPAHWLRASTFPVEELEGYRRHCRGTRAQQSLGSPNLSEECWLKFWKKGSNLRLPKSLGLVLLKLPDEGREAEEEVEKGGRESSPSLAFSCTGFHPWRVKTVMMTNFAPPNHKKNLNPNSDFKVSMNCGELKTWKPACTMWLCTHFKNTNQLRQRDRNFVSVM